MKDASMKARRIKKKRVFVGVCLTRKEAMRKAYKCAGDFRGFTYSPRTGWATVV